MHTLTFTRKVKVSAVQAQKTRLEVTFENKEFIYYPMK